MIKLVITDLDDTLYSWIGFFVPAFYDMVTELSGLVNISQEQLLKEYKLVHQYLKNVEYPYSTLLLPSIKEKYAAHSKEQILKELDPAFHKFNSTRKKLLVLYPGVIDFLQLLEKNRIIIVGYTDSTEENGFYRLKMLGVEQYFKDVFVSDSLYIRPDYIPSSPKTHVVHGKKPNPELILQICQNEGVELKNVLYIGDSISKDMLMAKQANVLSIWCDFRKENNDDLYKKLVEITHWDDNDFNQEKANKILWCQKGYMPDYTIHSFEELQKIIMSLNNL